jgi:small redox-active disulfide protein 2
MVIKVLGAGCKNCKKLLSNVEKAVKEKELTNVEVEYITDLEEISKTGLLRTPGLIFDKKIVSSGRVPNSKEVKEMLNDYLN